MSDVLVTLNTYSLFTGVSQSDLRDDIYSEMVELNMFLFLGDRPCDEYKHCEFTNRIRIRNMSYNLKRGMGLRVWMTYVVLGDGLE